MSKVCLVVIYNHNYEKNISVLNKIYAGRFAHVYHVMPFYTGDDPSVIGVYENSYQFSGYISQSADRFANDDYSHYIFVADDMVLNPGLSEGNILQELGVGSDDAFISECSVLTDENFVNWPFAKPSVMNLMGPANACEWSRFLPNEETAKKCFLAHGLDWRNGVSTRLYRTVRCGCRVLRKTPFRYGYIPPFNLISKCWRWLASAEKTYPLAWGYSDFCVIPKAHFRAFVQYSGVLAACRVFAEVAIPTALVLSCKRILTLSGSKWMAENGVNDYCVRQKIEADSSMDYSKLVVAFPKDYLYIHPVKLSKWRNLP